MATAVSRRYGTSEQCNSFVGVEGEIVVDITNKTLRVHVGDSVAGGYALARTDMGNVDTTKLATGAGSVSGHSGKNLMYSDLTNLNNNSYSTTAQISDALTSTYNLAKKDGTNIDTTGLATSTGRTGSGKLLAYSDLSNVDISSPTFAGLAKKDMSNVDVADIAGKGIAKNDMSNVTTTAIANKGIAKTDLSNVSSTSATLNSKDIQSVTNKTDTISSLSTSTQYPSASAVYTSLTGKQDTLTAGSNITISNNTISASGVVTTAEAAPLAYLDNVAIDSATLSAGQSLCFDPTLGTNGKWTNNASPVASVAFSAITGQPTDNANLASALSTKADDSNVVHKTGNESVAGTKTFIDLIKSKHSDVVKGTVPSQDYWWTLDFVDSVGTDINSSRLGMVEGYIGTNNITKTYLSAYKNDTTTNTNAKLAVVYDTTNNTSYAECPTPSADVNDNKIATTEWTNIYNNRQRTNCLTQIPQDINLELNNGTLTLKAGSKVYVPNGFDGTTPKFDVVTLASDITWAPSGGTAEPLFVFYNTSSSSMMYRYKSEVYSGATAPTATPNMIWYDTTNNIIKWTTDSGSTWNDTVSFFVCVVTANSDREVTSIDQVFNGFGYIGSTVFVLPGVKGLIPDGRNADGSLKNTEFTVSSVLTTTDVSGATGGLEYYLSGNGVFRQNFGSYEYKPDINYVWDNTANTSRGVILLDASAYRTSGRITSFSPKTAFHAVDYSELKDFSLPSQTGQAGKYLTTNGTTASWGQPIVVLTSEAPTGIDGVLYAVIEEY